jgi:hypothetical protein
MAVNHDDTLGGSAMRRYAFLILTCVLAALPQSVWAQRGEKWVVSWTGSAQGPYPIGNPSAQPDQKFAFPSPETGARNQTFRLIVRPDLWGRKARLRLTNVFGTKPVTFDGVFVGLQIGGASIVKGSNRPVTFGERATSRSLRELQSGAMLSRSPSCVTLTRQSLLDASSQ